MKKRNILTLVILMIFSLVLLTSCNKTTSSREITKDKTINYVEIVDKNNTYSFSSSSNVIEYKENLLFNQSDFILKIHYADGTYEDIQSGFTFSLFNIDNGETPYSGTLVPGSYKIHVVYENNPQDIYFSVSTLIFNEDNLTVELENSYTYNPSGAIEPNPVIKYSNKTLVLNTDYELIYGSNSSTGDNEGLIIIVGKGIYSGSIEKHFNISPKDPGEVNIPATVNYTYDGRDPKATIEQLVNNVEGILSVEYKYYQNGHQVSDINETGVYTVKVKFTSSYGYSQIANKEFTLNVNKKDISTYTLENLHLNNMQMPYIDSPYTTDDLEDYVSARVTDFEYMLAMVSGEGIDCYHISTSTTHGAFKIKGMGNYTGEILVPFTIVPLNISNASVITESDIYTGSAIKVKVYYAFSSTSKELEEGEDYTIEYENNVNAGTASYTITGLKDFGGSKVGTFSINKVSISPEDVYDWVDFNTLNYTYTGEVIEIDNLLVVKDGVTLDVDDIFDIEYKAYYNDHEVDIVHCVNYLIKAIITIKNNNYEFPINGDTVPVSYEMSKYDLSIQSAKATLTYTGKSSYEYTGERVGPTRDDVVITFGDYTLSEGFDYTVTLPTSSTNVGNNYTVTILLYNWDFYLEEGDYWSNINYTYSITPTEVKASALTIEWPALYKEVWHNHYYIQEQGTVKYNSATLTSEFFVGIRQIPGESGWYSNSLICYIRDENYKLLDENNNEISDGEIILYMSAVSGHPELPYVSGYTVTNNYFSSFEVDGQELTTEQIEAIYTSGKINYNQALDIHMASGYKIQYQSYSNIDGKDKGWSEKMTSLTLNVGSDLDLNGDPFEMHEIREVFFKLSKDDDEDFRAEVHLGVVRVEFTSEETKHYDGTPYVLTYNVYPQGYEVKLMFVHIVGGTHYDITGDIIDQGTYGVYVSLYNGDPATSPLVYRETLFTFTII